MFYSLWYNAPKLLLAGGLERGGTEIVSASGRQQLGCIIPQAVKHSLALLRMGKKIAQKC